MRREEAEIAVVGAGYAGSLMALILQRLGRRVILLERGRHPRFALGESSTPTANLVLADLAREYDLPRVAPLTKYGSWKRAYPDLTSGLKRGFSFFQHHSGQRFQPTPDHVEELLVASSPNDELSDTQWLRAEFDHFLVEEGISASVPYFDQIDLRVVERQPHWLLRGARLDEQVEVSCRFILDASGPGGFLTGALGIDARPTTMRTNSWSIYSHFENLGRFEQTLHGLGATTTDHPFPCDDGTTHHLLDDGWMWVIPFDNGVTSAGFLLDGTRRQSDLAVTPEREWLLIMDRYPSIAVQFAEAQPVLPWFRSGRLQRMATSMTGPDWAMLPHAAYALDALFSVGNAHTLLGIERLARLFAESWGQPGFDAGLRDYESMLRREAKFLDDLVHGCYRSFGRFRLFAAMCMFYFAGVHAGETRRREGQASVTDRFVSSQDEQFAAAVASAGSRVDDVKSVAETAAFEGWVRELIRPLNLGGFCDPAKFNMYPWV